MPRLPRKRILVNMFTTGIAFLLLALSFSRDDDNVLAGILGRGVKGDASLYSFPVKLGYSMLRKRLHRSLTWPVGGLCAALYRCGTPHCLRLQHNAATSSHQTIQPEATEDNLRLSKLSLGVRNPSPKSARLGWDFGSSCSVGGLWLTWGTTCVSSCCRVVGVYSVVAASP